MKKFPRYGKQEEIWQRMDLINRVICCGENKRVLIEYFPDECVDLIYLDPPFFSNRHYEVLWGNGAERRVYADRWKGGINHYIGWMIERLRELHRVLKPKGSVYLHCDWHAVHYLKVEMDKIFGEENFQNEIVWCYEIGARSKKRWGRKHDTILFYSRSEQFTFNAKEVMVSRKSGTHMRTGRDDEGRVYQEKTDRKTGKVYRYYLDKGAIPP